MSHSYDFCKNYTISLLKNIVVTIVSPDISGSSAIVASISKRDMVQNWINSIGNENILVESESNNYIDFYQLQNDIKNLKFPKIEILQKMSLTENLAYEALLLEISDKESSNVNISVQILYHLKLLTTHQIYKFNIFE